MQFYPQILSDSQQRAVKALGVLTRAGFYLGGGTALALQLGHRTSVDFDFYKQEKFDNQKLLETLGQLFPDVNKMVKQPEDTLQTVVLGVKLSAFYYPYGLIDDLVEFTPIRLASLEDLAAMKIAAVIQRAKQRDFVDIYYLIERLGIAEVIEAALKKYPWYQENTRIIFKALTYFDEADADMERSRVVIFDKSVSWEQVKQKIATAVRLHMSKGRC